MRLGSLCPDYLTCLIDWIVKKSSCHSTFQLLSLSKVLLRTSVVKQTLIVSVFPFTDLFIALEMQSHDKTHQWIIITCHIIAGQSTKHTWRLFLDVWVRVNLL